MQTRIQENFSLSRTALKFGLKSLELVAGDNILVPGYICDVALHPIQKIGLNIFKYPITDSFLADWSVIERIVNKIEIKAILLVHYFGQPQEIKSFKEFCNKNNIFLIEDNAHGYSGKFENKLLGTFGDIGISSPRKILGLPNGGILYFKSQNRKNIKDINQLKLKKWVLINQTLKSFLNYSPKLKGRLKGLYSLSINWSDPNLFHESAKPDSKIDLKSLAFIKSVDWNNISNKRRIAWDEWSNFFLLNNLKTVFPNVHPESCPWALPVYTANLKERNYWLKWGSRNGINIFPWPSLSRETINEDGPELERWKKLICIPLEILPKKKFYY